MKIKYVSFDHMNEVIRRNIFIVPKDIELIVGIPRSGMMPASIIAEMLNKRFTDIDSFVEGKVLNTGRRFVRNDHTEQHKVLIIDDTCFNGTSISNVRKRMSEMEEFKDCEFIYGCVFAEGANSKQFVDLYFEDISEDVKNSSLPIAFYEWNIFHHDAACTKLFMFDLDGVIGLDPPDERNTDEYIEAIKTTPSLIVPTHTIGSIVTYRLSKYRDITETWLKENHVKYDNLVMTDYPSYEDRANGDSPELYKAKVYANSQAVLFVESNDHQAKAICAMTKKPTFSVEANRIYNYHSENTVTISH